MLVKVISDYSVRYKGKLFSKGEVVNMDKEIAHALLKRGFVEKVKKEQEQEQKQEPQGEDN
ncbi:hypothetical protein SAMN04488516_11730 [Desulfonauticus submarinus]|uniref:Uncharacterized protein n=1 Tax=Desulfonauticus submarinus TaxID=206665 RepID=A0A1H0GAX2_9BACT|nr:hypothetical protein [Desulfonauticus submarinus]SDO04065.1 hypothetical protein SAMN04488516_11730 [Desulfonauticus submarinus]